MPKFAVQFYTKRTELDKPMRYGGLKKFDFKVLTDKEKKGRPPNCFRFQERTFLYVRASVKSFTAKGEPLIEYLIDNSIPNNGKVRTVITPFVEGELIQTQEEMEIASDLFDVTWARGEAKAVIAGSQKTKDELSMKSILIGALMGGFGGFIIALILYSNHVLH